MAGNISGLHVFANDTGPLPLKLLDDCFSTLSITLNTLSTFSNFFQDQGTTNAYTIQTTQYQFVSYADGLEVTVRIANTNTGASTLNVNGLGAMPILTSIGTELQPTALVAGSIVTFVYNAQRQAWQIGSGGAGGGQITAPLHVTNPTGQSALSINVDGSGYLGDFNGCGLQWDANCNFSFANGAGIRDMSAPFTISGPNGEPLFTVTTPVAGSGDCLVTLGPGDVGAIQSGPVLCLNGMTNYPVLKAWGARHSTPDNWIAEFHAGGYYAEAPPTWTPITPGTSFGVLVQGGTNATDTALLVESDGYEVSPGVVGSTEFFILRGDGSGRLGNAPNQLVWDAAGHFTTTGTATLPMPPLVDLPGINITNPQNGEALVYDQANNQWVNGAPVNALAALNDVTLSSPANGQSLIYNAATQRWINSTPASLLIQLGDVHISGPAPGQVLTYSISPTPGWVNATIPGFNFLSSLGVGPNPQAGWVLTWDGTAWVGAAPGQVAQFPLSSLTDVGITTPLNRQVLTYDAPNAKWINAPAPSPSLSTLPDVTLTSQTQGQVLSWNSSLNRWVNSSLPGGEVIALETLQDVNISDPQNNQVLTWDYAAARWENKPLPAIPAQALAGLSDVTLTSPALGTALSYNGTRWVNSNTLVGPVTLNAGTLNTLTAYGAVNYNTLNIHGGANTQPTPGVYVAGFTSHANVAGAANGVLIQAGNVSADAALTVRNAAGTATFLQVTGAGATNITQPLACLDASGAPVWRTLPSDATSLHVYQSLNGCGLWVEGANNSSTGADWVAKFVGGGNSAAATSYGVYIRGGTSWDAGGGLATDTAFQIDNSQGQNILTLTGAGTGSFGPPYLYSSPSLIRAPITIDWMGNVTMGLQTVQPTAPARLALQGRDGYMALYAANSGAEWISRLVNTNTSGYSFGLLIRAGLSGADQALAVTEGSAGTSIFVVRGNGQCLMPWTGVSGLAGNVNMDANGLITKQSSARRYKTNIRAMGRERAREIVRKLQPVRFTSLCAADDPSREFCGLIAEEVAEADPALVTYDQDGCPDGVQYSVLACILLPLVQELLGMDEPEAA